jgi:peptide deformylase
MTDSELDAANARTDEAFGSALRRWRHLRTMSQQTLSTTMGFDRSYISHVEAGRHPASPDFARKADTMLNAAGALWKVWQAHGSGGETVLAATSHGTAGLFVEHDHAELRYDGSRFTAAMRRTIVNAGTDPVTRYLVRISVDRYPGDPDASNRLYRQRPLTLNELGLNARCNGEPMAWMIKLDRDSFKEVWLRFENGQGRFPLYPGQRAALEYAYTVGDDKWGPWFQRAIRLPTDTVSVRLIFPAELDAAVWGTETSATAEAVALRTPISRDRDGQADVFTWSAADPPLNARYRLEWRFRGRNEKREGGPPLRRASDRMKAAGIAQDGNPVLAATADPFSLPDEADEARRVTDELLAAMQRVREHHVFGKGMGLAASQIGINRAAAIVQPPGDDARPLVLLDPRVIEESADTDEQYEGCLSFFDVRGLVPRPLRLEVEHTTLEGMKVITVFTDGLARRVAHEIDHLHGHLYTDRMRDGVQPISVEEYKDVGKAWSYDS